MKKYVFIALIVLLTCSLFFTESLANDEALDKILKSGSVKIGLQLSVPPLKFRDKNNEPAGLCVDFAKAFARDLGVEAEYVFVDLPAVIPSLLTGRIDIIFNDMSITLERAKKVLFTDPWMTSGSYMVVKKDSVLMTKDDVTAQQKNLRLSAGIGTNHAKTIAKVFPDAELVLYDHHTEQREAFKQGRDDVLVNEEVLQKELVSSSNGELRMISTPLAKDSVAFFVGPYEYHLLTWTNLWLARLIDSGEYDRLMNYWVKTDNWKKDYPGF